MTGAAITDPAGVNGQLAVVMANDAGAFGTMATSLYGFTPTNAASIGTAGSIRFATEFHVPGAFEVWSFDGVTRLRYEETKGAHFEGLYFQAASIARTITGGGLEAPQRPLDASLDTMATLDAIGRSYALKRLGE